MAAPIYINLHACIPTGKRGLLGVRGLRCGVPGWGVPGGQVPRCGTWSPGTCIEFPGMQPTLLLAHGAGAGKDHPWMTRVARGLEARGVTVVTFNFPYMNAKRSVPDSGPVLEEAYAKVWRDATAGVKGTFFAGGKSMGGRIASQAAARGLFDPAPAGLVFF